MPTWNDLLEQFGARSEEDRIAWLQATLTSNLKHLSALREDRHVILYGSAFLQKPQVPAEVIQIAHEDLNGFMATFAGSEWTRGLTLVLHTPGGVTNAAESIVSYMRDKFSDVEVIVPLMAMSAGTMIALASDRLFMGSPSQLGPIDPQLVMGTGRAVSAQAVVEQFQQARLDIASNKTAAHAWAPILASLGPALLKEAENALAYSERMVAQWLANHMLKDDPESSEKGMSIAHHFNDASSHKSHGRRIDRNEARSVGVNVTDLEANPHLQDASLTVYHLMTILFEQTKAAKIITNDSGRLWLKNWNG